MSDQQMVMPMDLIETPEVIAYRIALPFLPPSKNVYDNWLPQWKASAKRKWKDAIKAHALEQNLPMGISHVGLAAKLVFPTKQRRDPQNYAQCLWNWVPDALVQCGVLLDDREGMVSIGPNWGVQMAYDMRAGVPKTHRQRTSIVVSVQRVKYVREA